MTEAEDAALLFSPLSPAGEAVPAQWHFPVGLEDFPATADFHFWRREPGSPVGVLHPAGQPEEGLLLGEACALGCTGPLGLTAAEHALLGSCPAEGLAFFLCLGPCRRSRDGPSCASALCWPWLWTGGGPCAFPCRRSCRSACP